MKHFTIFLLACQIYKLFATQATSLTELNKNFNVEGVHESIRQGWKCVDIVNYYLNRAYAYNYAIKAIISYNPNITVEAMELDKYYEKHKTFIGRLHCVPLLVKDNVDVKNIATTAGVRALRYSIPNVNAPIVENLKKEGALVIAKANMAELAVGMFYDSSMGGKCRNPYDYSKSCGASSSGSGAGMAAGMGVIGIGSDTDGSIIYPAGFCSLYAIRPPQGKLDLSGIVPVFERQDTVGPMTKTIDDLVLSYSIMLGNLTVYDTFKSEVPNPSKLRIGYLTNFFQTFQLNISLGEFSYKIEEPVKKVILQAIENFRSLDIVIVNQTLDTEEFSNALRILTKIVDSRFFKLQYTCYKQSMNKYFNDSKRFEADSPYHSFDDFLNSKVLTKNLHDFLNQSNITNSEVKCAELCTKYEVLKADLRNVMKGWLDKYNLDSLIFATTPTTADPLNSSSSYFGADIFTSSSGLTAITIPAAYSKATKESPQGLPIGVMLLTKPETLDNTFKIAKIYEKAYVKIVLPHNTPLIEYQCYSTATSYSSNLLSFSLFFLIEVSIRLHHLA